MNNVRTLEAPSKWDGLADWQVESNWNARNAELVRKAFYYAETEGKFPSEIASVLGGRIQVSYEDDTQVDVTYLPAYDKYLVTRWYQSFAGNFENPPEWDSSEIGMYDNALDAIDYAVAYTVVEEYCPED